MAETSTITKKLLPFAMLKGIGPSTLRRIAKGEDFINETVNDVACRIKPVANVLKNPSVWETALEAADRQIEMATRYAGRILCVLDPDYPALLKEITDDPGVLYLRGEFAADDKKSVAIIGTREPTVHGKRIAENISRFFAEKVWSVVSGLAVGCDTVAHETALEANGHTVAVLAHGLHIISPSQNRRLAERILDSGGALVSEYPFGQGAYPHQFVKRDKYQAGLAKGVVMVQSDLEGGSLHASRAAVEYGRWLAVPYPTKQDLARSEPKVQANLLLAVGRPEERASLLRCQERDLARLVVLRSKEDYPLLLNRDMCGASSSVAHEQKDLLS